MIDVPMYQPRIPIRGGGGVIDLSSKENESKLLIAQAIGELLASIGGDKRQRQADELARRKTETDIAYRRKATGLMGQPEPVAWKIVTSEDKTFIYNPETGETKELKTREGKSIVPPKSAAGRKVMDAFNDIANLSRREDEGLLTGIEPEVIDEQKSRLRQEAMGGLGLTDTDLARRRSKFPAFGGMGAEKYYEPGGPGFMPRKEVEGKVKMKAPDGKTYEVDSSEVEEAKKHGWKLL